jgi:hypothetical protein
VDGLPKSKKTLARTGSRRADVRPSTGNSAKHPCSHAIAGEHIETINDKLLNTFRLDRERPHDVTGFQARLAAKVGLHNFCLWLNLHLGRAPLAFADLLRKMNRAVEAATLERRAKVE